MACGCIAMGGIVLQYRACSWNGACHDTLQIVS